MSLLNWLKKPQAPANTQVTFPKPILPSLPDPNQETCPVMAKRITLSNARVTQDFCDSLVVKPRGQNNHHTYSDEFRTKVARSAIATSSNKAAAEFNLPLSTVKTWRGKLLKNVKQQASVDFSSAAVVSQPKGRPTKLPDDFDKSVMAYLRKMQSCGGSLSWKTVVSVASAIVEAEYPSLMKKHGGDIEFTKKWAYSVCGRMNFVKRKATKAASKLPADFDVKKENFLFAVCAKIFQHLIPLFLVLNWDQTGISMVPANKYSLAPRGSKDVAVFGQDDKRQITVGATCSFTGELLPFQVIYEGTTERCHPDVEFPPSWHITHSASHWSTAATMIEMAVNVLIPFREKKILEEGLSPDQKALLILDNHATHKDAAFLQLLRENGFIVLFLPANCTSHLQPLDLSFNAPLKRCMTEEFIAYQSSLLAEQLKEEKEQLKIDLRVSVLKPEHAKWLMRSFDSLRHRPKIIMDGWEKAGIADAVRRKEEIFAKNQETLLNPFLNL